MKKCLTCGFDNKNDNAFCSSCGGTDFSEPYSTDDSAAPAVNVNNQPPMMPPPPPYQAPRHAEPKKPFGFFDVLTILGFVSSLVGLWCIWVVLEPLAVISALLGFLKGSRSKGLAAAGIVIAVIAFIVRLFFSLYDNNFIGRWAVEGVFR
ncbi:MAG: hypothetical protein IJU82_08110 [Ruminiclostridium sp.]|nr:hypothetical protein [Ruminiclostridium sp.]